MMTYPEVMTEEQTVEALLSGRSIARYGDGELKLCLNGSAKSQPHYPNLSTRLRQILKSRTVDCLVAIPNIADRSRMDEQKKQFWSQYTDRRYTDLYNANHIYGSAFITRPDSAPNINNLYHFDRMKQIWWNREVILIGGDNKPFDKDPSILNGCQSVEHWSAPSQDAWALYPTLYEKALSQPKEKLFLICLGATATVLAYDLAHQGYQALDLGHLGMFYARAHRSN